MPDSPSFDPDAYTSESRAAWDAAAAPYEALSNRLFGGAAEGLVEFAGVRRGWRVLDLACGPGLASRAAARAAGERGAVVAGDLSPGMIALARSAPMPKRAAPIEWRELDAQKLPFGDAEFDAVVCSLGLMLFAKPDAALSEMARVAKPGAPVACMVQGRPEKMVFTSLVLRTLAEQSPELEAPPGAPTLYAFSPDGALESAFARARLVEISTKRLSGTFTFKNGEEYWSIMTEGAGRAARMLAAMPADAQAKVKKRVLRRVEKHRTGSRLLVPYEFALARGHKR